MTKVGSITFGPVLTPNKDSASGYRLQSMAVQYPYTQACNCIGPQPGQTKCPCALMGESRMGQKMVDEGVTINGKHYKLVPTDQ